MTQPVTDIPSQCPAGRIGMRPRCGFRPKRPQKAAGFRIDPAPSEAEAAAHSPAASAAPLPPLDPLGVRSVSHGLRVMPLVLDSVNPQTASSGRFVLPRKTAPAWRRLATIGESEVAVPSNPSVPSRVGSPSMSSMSLIAIGTPRNGASSPAPSRRSASSACASALSALT